MRIFSQSFKPAIGFLVVYAAMHMPCFAERGPVVVTVPYLHSFTAQNPSSMAQTAVIRRFLELHPEVTIKKATGLQIEGVTGTSKDMVPLMQIAGDISPDILAVNFRCSDTYIKKGYLKPLDDYVKMMSREELELRVPPAIRGVCFRKGPDGGKHWYALPITRGVRLLAYRRDLFARAGLDPDNPPRTWSELAACSRKLCDPTKGRYGMGFNKGDMSAWDFANLVWSRGGEIVVQGTDGRWRLKFDSDQVVDALEYYVRLNTSRWKASDGKYYRGVACRDTGVDVVISSNDQYAMSFAYLSDSINEYNTERIGFAAVPHSDDVPKGASEINSMMFGIYAGTKDPAVSRAAFDYIRFLDSDEANSIRVKIFVQNGHAKLVNANLLRRFGYANYVRQADESLAKAYDDAFVNGSPEPYGENCSVIYRELSRPVEQALNDRRVLTALDNGDDQALRRRLKSILHQAQVETSMKMYGTLPPATQALRRNLTALFLVLMLAVLTLATLYLSRVFRTGAPAQTPGNRRTFFACLMLFPAVGSVIVWQYLPLLRGTLMSFQDYNLMSASQFVGIRNFSDVLFDAGFWHSIHVTLLYTLLYMTFAFISPIVLAILLSEVPRGKMFFRTIFYLPAIMSGLVVVYLWKSFYKPSGLLNTLLSYVGIHLNIGWIDSPSFAMLAVILPVMWAGMGPGSLIYLAAFKTIPNDLYEAAEVDGAGIFKKICSITLPSIKMLVFINAIGGIIGAFMSSESIFAMTGGGPYTPYGATEVVGLQIFYTAFVYVKFGMANAMAWVLGFMLIGLTMMQLKNLSRVEFKGGR